MKHSISSEETAFEKESKYNKNRTSYFDSDYNYVYVVNENKREIIPYSDEFREVFEFLDESDHEMDLQERRERENRVADIKPIDDKDTRAANAIERAADENPFEMLFSDSVEDKDDLKVKFEEWIEALSDSQQDLIYKRFGMRMTFEEIRLEEEKNGKHVTKQAIHNRWKKIQEKIKKKFGCHFPD